MYTAPRPRPAGAVDRDERLTTAVMMVVPGVMAAMVPSEATAVTATAAAATTIATVHNQPFGTRLLRFRH